MDVIHHSTMSIELTALPSPAVTSGRIVWVGFERDLMNVAWSGWCILSSFNYKDALLLLQFLSNLSRSVLNVMTQTQILFNLLKTWLDNLDIKKPKKGNVAVSCKDCYLCNPNLNFVNVMLTDSSMFELKLKPLGPDSSTQCKMISN